MKAFYDAIVLGPAPAGRAAAALLARDGYRVLVLDGPAGVGTGGVPASAVVTGLDAPATAALFGTLGLDGAVKRLVRPRPVPWQFASPRVRLDVAADDDALARALEREAPEVAGGVVRFFARVSELRAPLDAALAPGAPLWPRGLLARARSGLRRGRGVDALAGAGALELLAEDAPLLRAIALAPAPFLARVLSPGADAPPALAAARAIDALRRSSAAVEGGADAVAAALTEAAVRHGASVLRGAAGTPLEIVLRRAHAEGVRTMGSADVLGASVVLAGCELRTLAGLCPGRATHARVRRARAAMTPERRVLLLDLALPDEALPPGLGALLFAVADPALPLEGANCLRVERTAGGLLVACIGPEEPDGEARARLRAQVLDALEGPCPFVTRHVRDAGPLIETAQPVCRAAEPPLLGAIGPWPDSGLDNVFVGGAEAAPGLDLEREVLAAAALVERVVERLGARAASRPAGAAVRILK